MLGCKRTRPVPESARVGLEPRITGVGLALESEVIGLGPGLHGQTWATGANQASGTARLGPASGSTGCFGTGIIGKPGFPKARLAAETIVADLVLR